MQAIQTKWLCPTNTKGSRIKAQCDAGSVIIPVDGRLNQEAGHRKAAMDLADKLDWVGDAYGDMVTGSLPDGSYCHVFTTLLSRGET